MVDLKVESGNYLWYLNLLLALLVYCNVNLTEILNDKITITICVELYFTSKE